MLFKEFIEEVEGPLRLYIQYSLKKRNIDLSSVADDEIFNILREALGAHVSKLLYAMYLERRAEKQKVLPVSN